MDFKSFLKDAYSHNTAFIVMDWLYKQSVSLPCFKTITIKNIAHFYINNIYWNHSAPKLIVLDYGL